VPLLLLPGRLMLLLLPGVLLLLALVLLCCLGGDCLPRTCRSIWRLLLLLLWCSLCCWAPVEQQI
jgi:hypothetical protein